MASGEKNGGGERDELKALLAEGDALQRDFADFIDNMHALVMCGGNDRLTFAMLKMIGALKPRKWFMPFFGAPPANKPDPRGSMASLASLLDGSRTELMTDIALFEVLKDNAASHAGKLDMIIEKARPLAIDEGGDAPDAELREMSDLMISRTVILQSIAKLDLLLSSNRTLLQQVEALLTHALPLWKLSQTINAERVTRKQQAVNRLQAATLGTMVDARAAKKFIRAAAHEAKPLRKVAENARQSKLSIAEEISALMTRQKDVGV